MSQMNFARNFAGLALLASAFTARQAPAAQLDAARLEPLFREAGRAVDDACGTDLATKLPLRLVTVDELAACLMRERLPALRTRFPDAKAARKEAREFGQQAAQIVYAKLAWNEHAVLFVPRTLSETAVGLERPELLGDDALRAVFVHEFIHAVDHARFALDDTYEALTDDRAVSAFAAVVEGHAQHRARSICAAHGWSAGFDVFTGAIGALPKDAERGGEATAMLLRVIGATVSTSYVQGERFIAAVHAAEGDAGVERAFREPPRDIAVVFQPAWFLDPTSRPRAVYDFEPALDVAGQRFDAATWSRTPFEITPAQLDAALSLLPAQESLEICAQLVDHRCVRFSPLAAPDSKMVVVVVYDFGTPAAAERFVASSKRLSAIKDEKMKTGSTRITVSAYERVELGGIAGFIADKTVAIGFGRVRVRSLVAARGRLVIETTFSAEDIEDAAHATFALTVLGKVALRPPPANPR